MIQKLLTLMMLQKNTNDHNSNWPRILDHLYRILTTVGSVSGKTNSLFNLIGQQPYIDKMYLYTKYQFLINKRESTVLKNLNYSKSLVEYANDMDNIYKNIEKYNLNKKRKILTVFDDMIADLLSNKKI